MKNGELELSYNVQGDAIVDDGTPDGQYALFCETVDALEVGDGETTIVLDTLFSIKMAKAILEYHGVTYDTTQTNT